MGLNKYMDEVDDMDRIKWIMDNGKWTVAVKIAIMAVVLLGVCWGQIETHMIDMADPGTYLSDKTVYIKRDTSGYLVFADSASGGEKTLAELINSSSTGVHANLTGLGNDDHPQYYNSTRLYSKLGSSNVGTGATYVNSLPISGDVGGQVTIGAHVADAATHGKPKHRATVDASGGQYATIGAAIAALATTGGVVDVSPGTYDERIELVNNIRINAAPGAVMTYGSVYPPAVKVPTGATSCVIRGLTIRSTNTSSGYALVEVSSGSDLVLENCDVDGDSSYNNVNTLSVAGTCYVRNSRIWSQRKPVYVTGTCQIEQSRIYTVDSSSTDPVIYSEGYLQIRNVWIDGCGSRYGVQVAGGETKIWGAVLQRVTEDIYRTAGLVYIGQSVYEAETGTVTREVEGYKVLRGVDVERTARGTENPYEYSLSGEGVLFSVDTYGNLYASGNVSCDRVIASNVSDNDGSYVLTQTSASPSGLLGVTEIAGTGGTYQPGDEIYYRLYSYRTFDGEKICSADYIERLAGPVVGTDAYIILDWAAVDGVDGYRVVSFKTGDTDWYITDLEGGDTVSWDDFGSHFVPVLWDLQPFESEGVTTTTINSADGVYGVHTNKDVYGRAFYGDGSNLTGVEKPKGNTLVVAKSGGDYDKIQDAVDAATTGTTVLVFPGVYEEKVAINKAISLVGTDKNNCVIKHNKDGREDAVVMVRAFMSGFAEIKDLTLWNTGESYSTALRVERPARISNCVMIGNHADTVILKCLYSKHSIYVDNCYITGYYDTLTFASNAGHAWVSNSTIVSATLGPVWAGTVNCNAHIDDCNLILTKGEGGGINLGEDAGKGIKMYLSNVRCFNSDRTAIPLFRSASFGTGTTAYVSNCEYSEIGNSNVSIVYTKTSAINADGNSVFGGSINAGSLKIGGTETVSSSRAVSAVGLSNSETRWKDWAAVAACGAAVVWDGNRGRNVGWSPGYGDAGGCIFYIYLLSDDYGQRVYFPIPYEAGTILTRLRVKWCANAQDNGIKVRLVKRDETAYNDAWTVVGAQQSYIDSAGDLNININTYDFADETMQANYSYSIEVESVVDNPVGVRLYSVGIETSKRVY